MRRCDQGILDGSFNAGMHKDLIEPVNLRSESEGFRFVPRSHEKSMC